MGRRAKGDAGGELAMAATMVELRARWDSTGRFALYLDPAADPTLGGCRVGAGDAMSKLLGVAARWLTQTSSAELVAVAKAVRPPYR
jgi:hypothetical protein